MTTQLAPLARLVVVATFEDGRRFEVDVSGKDVARLTIGTPAGVRKVHDGSPYVRRELDGTSRLELTADLTVHPAGRWT